MSDLNFKEKLKQEEDYFNYLNIEDFEKLQEFSRFLEGQGLNYYQLSFEEFHNQYRDFLRYQSPLDENNYLEQEKEIILEAANILTECKN